MDASAPDAGSTCIEPDEDGDGFDSVACGGTDCDDQSAARSPARTEVCDDDDVDEDCNATTFGDTDGDRDGAVSITCCNLDSLGVARCGRDCDDARAGVSPTATEACDGRDNDCDGGTDESVMLTFYRDVDGDGFGVTAMSVMDCSLPTGHALMPGDCDDAAPSVHPAADEACDLAMTDEDCDLAHNEGCACAIGEPPRDCGSSTDEGVCNVGEQECLSDGTWSTICVGGVGPGVETCNALDDDCDAMTDEELDLECWPDMDDDGYALAGVTSVRACPDATRSGALHGSCPPNLTARMPCATAGDPGCLTTADCNDLIASRSPAAPEVCDGVDQNCDEAIDSPGFLCRQTETRACALMGGPPGSGMQTCLADCSGFGACSGPEVCNGIDDNGNGTPDDGFDCVRGVSSGCTTACGVPTNRTCSATCTQPVCTSVETCNFCDDDMTGDGDPDRSLATATVDLTAPLCSQLLRAGSATCWGGGTDQLDLTANVGSTASAAWFPGTARVGWGPITHNLAYYADARVSGPPADGIAIFINSNLASSRVGAPGIAVGVPSDLVGIVAEWHFGYYPGYAGDMDVLDVFVHPPGGGRYSVLQVPFTGMWASERLDDGGYQAGRLVIVYRPAVGGTSASVDVLLYRDSVSLLQSLTGGPINIADPFPRGARVEIGVSAATGGAVSSTGVHLDGMSFGRVESTCPGS